MWVTPRCAQAPVMVRSVRRPSARHLGGIFDSFGGGAGGGAGGIGAAFGDIAKLGVGLWQSKQQAGLAKTKIKAERDVALARAAAAAARPTPWPLIIGGTVVTLFIAVLALRR